MLKRGFAVKNKILNVIFEVAYIALLIAGIRDPQTWLINLPAAFIWVMNIFVWLAAVTGAAAYMAGRESREKIHAQLARLFNRPAKNVLSRVYGWGMKILIVISLACSGWLLTLVSYVLTVIIFQICRSALAEAGATCRAS